jgi:hypothetical protein
MQRRLQRQQGTIRLLMVLMGLVLVGSILVIGVMIKRLAELPEQAAPSAAEALQNAVTESTPTPAAQGSGDATPDESMPAPAALERDEPVAETAPDDLSSPAVQAPGDQIEQDHQRAQALLVEARKESRPLKDRIKACEEAVTLLKAVKSRATPTETPGGLEQEIAEADRLLERLRLQEYFP